LPSTGADSHRLRQRSIGVPDLSRAAPAALLVAWCALLVAALACGLGSYPLLDPDEGRNAEVAREMAATGDYLVPRLDGLPYLDKPVLFFALDALAIRALGATELAARLPALLFALATAALVAAFAGRLFGRASAWVAGTAAATAPLAVVFARAVIFDSLLAFLVTLALVAFYLAIESAGERWTARAWSALGWVAIALGVLTKGPVALAVPLLVAIPYALWRRAGRVLWSPAGPLLFLALVLPWVWAMARAVPEFLEYALVSETWRRMTTDQFERTGPFWYFLPSLLIGALPWSFVVLGARRRLIRDLSLRENGVVDRRLVFLLLWLGLPILLFSLSHSKRPQYILPLLPAVALLVAAAWRGAGDAAAWSGAGETMAWRQESAPGRPLPGARVGAGAWIVFGIALVGAGLALPGRHAIPAGQAGPIARVALFWGIAAVLGGIGAWWSAPRREAALVALALPAVVLPLLLTPALRAIGDTFSSRDLAAAVAPHLSPGVEVVGLRAYPASLPFYLGRTILVVGPRGRELTSNYIIDSYPKWLAARDTPLRPLGWWPGALAACERPMLFVAHSEDRANRAVLSGAPGLPLLYEDNDFAAYGPCRAAGGR
jgi:4-amino-4-deoxy-L-arabinose transferase-like glycosyltransferase